jgi:2-iminobutanoate/2-iminopropanoate deaminase
MKKAIQIENAPAPIAPYSPAILAGNTLYVSGQIPVNPITRELNMPDIKTATRQIMQNIGNLLNAAGMDYANIVKCTIFLANFDDYQGMNEAYGEFFGEIPPAREAVQVVKLPMGAIVEISCIAVM